MEDLLRFCEERENGIQTARRVVREYLADLATSKHSLSNAMVRCTAVKSYFATHDVRIDVRVDKRRHAVHDVWDPPEMSLFDLYKMMTVGCMNVALEAIMMIKFQAGLDASTFADRFNFEGYPQITKHFRIEECGAWDPGRGPVQIRPEAWMPCPTTRCAGSWGWMATGMTSRIPGIGRGRNLLDSLLLCGILGSCAHGAMLPHAQCAGPACFLRAMKSDYAHFSGAPRAVTS